MKLKAYLHFRHIFPQRQLTKIFTRQYPAHNLYNKLNIKLLGIKTDVILVNRIVAGDLHTRVSLALRVFKQLVWKKIHLLLSTLPHSPPLFLLDNESYLRLKKKQKTGSRNFIRIPI